MELQRDGNQMVSGRIADFLKKECPVFTQRQELEGPFWYNYYCKITMEPCTCIWHLTDYCHQGVWDMFFLKELYERQEGEKRKAQKLMIETDLPKLKRLVKSKED